jgi:hypothetical protein
MSRTDHESEHPSASVVIDFSRIPDGEFEATRPLLIATMQGDEVISSEVITPSDGEDPRRVEVSVRLASADGVSGARVVVAPADDERNLRSDKAAQKFVSGQGHVVDGGVLYVTPGLYRWWRLCWFPHTYHVTGRVVRQDGDCTHPVGAALVELFDVDYCWWWYAQDLVATTTTDGDGFFDVTFTWCVPLWCVWLRLLPPLYVDPDLRDQLRAAVEVHFPSLPDPPSAPQEWEAWLQSVGVRLPAAQSPAPTAALAAGRSAIAVKPTWTWEELFGPILRWWGCDPCDRLPNLRIVVTQNQPGVGAVEIYSDSYSQIHWNLSGDLLDLTLDANASALYVDACRPDPLLGKCMLLERVGGYNVSTIYEPDLVPGASYGATPDRAARLGRTVDYDRAWCETLEVHGDFGLAAGVDYYQVQIAQWTAADVAAWTADATHVPDPGNFAAVSTAALGGFTRSYADLVYVGGWPVYVWVGAPFAPQTIGGVEGLYESRERFEQNYEAAHGGDLPAPDFTSGWYWDTTEMTTLYDLDTTQLADGLYSLRIVGYQQTGVDAGGAPTLALVEMGLADGVCVRCGGPDAPVVPELLTLRTVNDPHKPACAITGLSKNGAGTVAECDLIVLDDTDSLWISFQATDVNGELDSYSLTLQRGSDAPVSVFAAGVGGPPTGSTPAGPTYADALVDPSNPVTDPPGPAPVWKGGSWTVVVPESAFASLGGSCAYDLTLFAVDRQTNGYSAGADWPDVTCSDERAFTVILAGDRAEFCAQLGCPELVQPVR